MMIHRRSLLWLLPILALILVTGCSQSKPPSTSQEVASLPSHLPEFLADAPPTVKEAYEYAAAHPEEIEKYPCFCGCGSMGHTSNLSCYIKDMGANGEISWDNHAAGCGICVDITRDVMRLKDQGMTSPQIRTYIDATYSAFGPSTNTALPIE